MNQFPLHRRVLLWMCLVLAFGIVLTPLAEAAWGGGGTGTASAAAVTMPMGNQPSAGMSSNSAILTWSAAFFPDSHSVAGYVIRRFDAATGAEATVGAGCSGRVTATTCTETNLRSGTWVYTDTPVQGNWSGGQSSASARVNVP